jgi:biotin transport system substrate-specific component
VPITLKTLGIMLTGGVLGARKGFLAVAVFLLLATAGLPLLAGGRGGVGIWAGPSAGIPGRLACRRRRDRPLTARILPRYPLWQGIAITDRRCAGRLPVRRHLARRQNQLGQRRHQRV